MLNIYIDESIHDRAEFIAISAVYSEEDIAPMVSIALTEAGFQPGVDEYKSSMLMANNSAAQDLRSDLQGILGMRCKIGVAICPTSKRGDIMQLAAQLIRAFPHDVLAQGGDIYFDEGMKVVSEEFPAGWKIHTNCDSKRVFGIQVADCAAYLVSVLILAELGFFSKTMKPGDSYPADEVELDWALWTSIRYALSSGEPVDGYDEDGWCDPMMLPYALLIDESCSPAVIEAAKRRLGRVWIGCIH